jgi:hypothetical protein
VRFSPIRANRGAERCPGDSEALSEVRRKAFRLLDDRARIPLVETKVIGISIDDYIERAGGALGH